MTKLQTLKRMQQNLKDKHAFDPHLYGIEYPHCIIGELDLQKGIKRDINGKKLEGFVTALRRFGFTSKSALLCDLPDATFTHKRALQMIKTAIRRLKKGA